MYVIGLAFAALARRCCVSIVRRDARPRYCRRLRPLDIWGKVLYLFMVERVAGYNQPMGLGEKTIAVSEIDRRAFDLPDHRTFCAVLDMESLPRLSCERPREPGQVFDRRAMRALPQVRPVPPHRLLRCAAPGPEVDGHFYGVQLPAARKFQMRLHGPSVRFIFRHPGPMHTPVQRLLMQFQRDLPLRPMNQFVWNPGFPAALPIRGPTLRQEQRAGKKTLKIGGEAEEHGRKQPSTTHCSVIWRADGKRWRFNGCGSLAESRPRGPTAADQATGLVVE